VTQPPDEPPPPGDGQQPWQPPGPPPPPPPYGQNPYGGGTTSPYQPIDSGGMGSGVKVTLGVLIGLFGGFFLWIFAAILFAGTSGSSGDNTFLFWAAIAPLIVPAPLLIWKATRPWGVGLLIGTAVCSIGLSSLCSSLIGTPG
jgi:hypothetical protein